MERKFDTVASATKNALSYDGAADYSTKFVGVIANDNGTFSDFGTDALDNGEMQDPAVVYLAKMGQFGYSTIKGLPFEGEEDD